MAERLIKVNQNGHLVVFDTTTGKFKPFVFPSSGHRVPTISCPVEDIFPETYLDGRVRRCKLAKNGPCGIAGKRCTL